MTNYITLTWHDTIRRSHRRAIPRITITVQQGVFARTLKLCFLYIRI